jgi:hypothetical protein
MAYLVKCSGTASNTYSVPLKQSPQLPANSWVRNGANLLGFPTYKNGGLYPTMSSYFATFPAAIAANAKVYKYVGGDLGAGNPVQIFSTSLERLDATQAYWFSAEVTGNFYAPLEISPSSNDGLAFGDEFGEGFVGESCRLRRLDFFDAFLGFDRGLLGFLKRALAVDKGRVDLCDVGAFGEHRGHDVWEVVYGHRCLADPNRILCRKTRRWCSTPTLF